MKFSVTAAAVAAAAIAMTAMPAAAQSLSAPAFYGTAGYTAIDAGSGVDLGAVTGRLGARLHRYFGAEAELGLGVDGDKNAGGLNIHTKLKHSVAGYAVGYLPVSPNVELFARGGYGVSRIKASLGAASVTDNLESWNYGAGGQYLFDEKNGVRAEYTRYDFDNNNGSADTWSVSYVRKF